MLSYMVEFKTPIKAIKNTAIIKMNFAHFNNSKTRFHFNLQHLVATFNFIQFI